MTTVVRAPSSERAIAQTQLISSALHVIHPDLGGYIAGVAVVVVAEIAVRPSTRTTPDLCAHNLGRGIPKMIVAHSSPLVLVVHLQTAAMSITVPQPNRNLPDAPLLTQILQSKTQFHMLDIVIMGFLSVR